MRPALEAKLQRIAPPLSGIHTLLAHTSHLLTRLSRVPEPVLLFATAAVAGAAVRVVGLQGCCPAWLAHSTAWGALLLGQLVNGMDCYPFRVC